MDQTTPQTPVAQAQAPATPHVQPNQPGFRRYLNGFFQNKKLLWTILAVVGGLVLIKTIFFKPAVISVVGTGEMTAKPAQVEMLVTKVDSNPDPVVAINVGEESISDMMAKAKELGGEDVEIQKSFYQVTPSVVGGDVLYQVVNIFKITAEDPALASGLIKGFYAAGATTVSGVNFIPEEQEDVTQEVRKLAIKDAKSQARNIARASGKRLGRIISIGDDFSEGSSTVSTDGAGQVDPDAPAQLNYANGVPSEIDVSKSMTVTYQIW